jgi:putative ABC transport system ATP-binding protein
LTYTVGNFLRSAFVTDVELFQSLNDEGVTIVMITHDINIAKQAKRILHIVDGEIFTDDEEGKA